MIFLVFFLTIWRVTLVKRHSIAVVLKLILQIFLKKAKLQNTYRPLF